MKNGAAPIDGERFDRVTMLIHWITLAMIAVQFSTAWMRAQASGDQATLILLVHRSNGVLLWGLTVARLLWRAARGRKVALPAATPALQRLAARITQYGLYGLLAVQPLTGMAQSVLRGKAFPLFFGDMPALMARDKALVRLFEAIHEQGALLLLALIGLHTGAALFHRFVLRDGVLASMLPRNFSRAGNNHGPVAVLPVENHQYGSPDDE